MFFTDLINSGKERVCKFHLFNLFISTSFYLFMFYIFNFNFNSFSFDANNTINSVPSTLAPLLGLLRVQLFNSN